MALLSALVSGEGVAQTSAGDDCDANAPVPVAMLPAAPVAISTPAGWALLGDVVDIIAALPPEGAEGALRMPLPQYAGPEERELMPWVLARIIVSSRVSGEDVAVRASAIYAKYFGTGGEIATLYHYEQRRHSVAVVAGAFRRPWDAIAEQSATVWGCNLIRMLSDVQADGRYWRAHQRSRFLLSFEDDLRALWNLGTASFRERLRPSLRKVNPDLRSSLVSTQ
jgi:hypothetical protein